MIKFSLRNGAFSLDYEGEEGFLKNDLAKVLDVLKQLPVAEMPEAERVPPPPAGQQQPPPLLEAGAIPKHSTNTIAKLLNVTTGPDLILAAVAKVIIVEGHDLATRKDISREMKAAPSYYKKTYLNNLSAYLDNLTKADRIRLASQDTYGLPARERDRIEQIIREQ